VLDCEAGVSVARDFTASCRRPNSMPAKAIFGSTSWLIGKPSRTCA